MVPLTVFHRDGEPIEIEITVTAPTGWKVMAGTGKFRLPEESRTDLLVEIATPELTKEELKKVTAQELIVRGSVAGKSIGEVRLMAKLRAGALAQ
jgi:hypothetical protein